MTAMSTVSVQDICRDPEAFLGRVEAGETFVVVRGDEALAEVRPFLKSGGQLRPFGLCAGAFKVPEHFDEPLPDELLKEFEGS